MNDEQSTTASTQNADFKTVEIGGGRVATMLAPDLNAEQKLCVISETMLKRLVELLPTAEFYKIRRDLRNRIDSTTNIDEMVAVCAAEVDFHTSVRRTEKFFAQDKPEVVTGRKVAREDEV